jgi:predicted alpha/beta-hydrolase family hydrolase
MDSPFLATIAAGLAAAGWRVVRFEFASMARMRETGRRQVRLGWIPSGDHSFKPSRRSGLSEAQNWATAVAWSDRF